MIQHGRVQAPKASFVAGLIFFCLLSGSALFAESPLIVDAKRAIKAKEDFQAAALLSDFLRSASNPTEALEARFLLGQIPAGWRIRPRGSVFSRRPSTITRTPPIGPVLFSFWPLSIFGTASIADPSCSLPNSLKNTPAQRKSPMRESTLKT